MTRPEAFLRHASELLDRFAQDFPDEMLLRRAVCASYYGLFHTLSDEAAGLLAPAQDAFRNQVRRSLNHGPMAKVCNVFVQARGKTFPPPFNTILPQPPPDELFDLAALFVELQEARHAADYDLTAVFSFGDVIRLTEKAWNAAAGLPALRAHPATRVFLSALLLPGKRNG